ELSKKGPVVLAFFPKAFTSVCTAEMKSFRDQYAKFSKEGATVIGASTDDQATQARFKKELKLPFAMIADEKGELAKAYGAKTPLVNYAKRRTFVIGKDGKISHVFESSDAAD